MIRNRLTFSSSITAASFSSATRLPPKEWPRFPAEIVLPGNDAPQASFAVLAALSKLGRLMWGLFPKK
jgi:hypothetical protein